MYHLRSPLICSTKRLVPVLVLICALFSLSLAQQRGLPHTFTEEERIEWQFYEPPATERGISSPPPAPVRTMAEWEELQGIQITWTSFPEILSEIIRYAQTECMVHIICSDSNQVKNYLLFRNIPTENLVFLLEPFDSIWCRDYGPWTVYEEGSDNLYFIDWIYNRPRPNDDLIPDALGSFLEIPVYSTTEEPDDLVNTGGNFMTDGHGNAFASKLVLEENPDKSEAEIDDIMSRYMGISRFVKLDILPYDEIHHIDMHMKLLDEETLLVGEYPEGVSDGPQIEANLQYILANFNTCFDRAYKVVRIPMPPDAQGEYPEDGGDYRTYTNALIVNKTVIVPTYEEKFDTTALRIYEEAMPGYRVVGIDCNDIIPSLGAIHCITKEIGIADPIHISHAGIRYALETDPGHEVVARITSNGGIDSAFTYWTVDTSSAFSALPMTETGTDSFSAAIPAQIAGTDVDYYISAFAGNGRSSSKPLVAPEGCYTFRVDGTSGNLISRADVSPALFELTNHPNPFNGSTTLSWKTSENRETELNIYDCRGRNIHSASIRSSAGINTYIWSPDASSEPFSSGIYFCRIQSGPEYLSRKLIIVK